MEDPAAKRARVGDASSVGTPSELDILQLVAQRESFRQRQQFAESDQIREQLKQLGVELFDKDREWRSKDGRRGVLFTAGPFECHLSDAEIQAKVAEREEARRSKEWERSNIIRDDLRSIGVELNDKEAVWRTLSGRSGTYNGISRAGPLPGHQIHQMIAERERMRENKEFDAADRIRAQLAQHGVEIFDQERLWKTVDGHQGVIITGGHEVYCTLTDAEIATRVQQREEARATKRWGDADMIRDELRKQGIEMLDSQRVWCTTDGRQGPYPPLAGGGGGHQGPPSQAIQQYTPPTPPPPPAPPAPGGSPYLPAAQALVAAAGNRAGTGDIAAVAAQAIAGLVILAQRGTPPTSPQVIATITALGNSGGGGAPGGGGGNGSLTLCDASILALVTAREQARARQDFATADAIRSDLRRGGVEVWDKERMWRANDGRSGAISQPAKPVVGMGLMEQQLLQHDSQAAQNVGMLGLGGLQASGLQGLSALQGMQGLAALGF